MQLWEIDIATDTAHLTDIREDGRSRAEFRLLNPDERHALYYSHQILDLLISGEEFTRLHREIGLSQPSIVLGGIEIDGLLVEIKQDLSVMPVSAIFSAKIRVPSTSVRFTARNQFLRTSPRVVGFGISRVYSYAEEYVESIEYIPTRKSSGVPVPCQGCQHYDGSSYGGNKLVCGMHPTGYEASEDNPNCPDHEAGSKYKRKLDVRVENQFDLAANLRARVEVEARQRSTPSLRAGGQLTRHALRGLTTVWVYPGDLRSIGDYFPGSTLKVVLQQRSGVREYFVTGIREGSIDISPPLAESVEAGSNWLLTRELQEVEACFALSSLHCACSRCRAAAVSSPRPRVEFRPPQSVNARNTATPIRATQNRLRSALQALTRIERQVKKDESD